MITEHPITHQELSEMIVRPCGQPPSQCRGMLARDDTGDREVPWTAPGTWDDCQVTEGKIGEMCEVFPVKCACDHNRIILVRRPDGTWASRNEYPGPVAPAATA